MKKTISILIVFMVWFSIYGQIDTTIYGIARNSSPAEIFLAKINPATGVVSNISSSSVATSYTLSSTTVDPYNKIFYIITDGKFTGIDMVSGNVVSNPTITNVNGKYFDEFLFNCSDSTIYGLARKSSPPEIYFAKINPTTGVVTNISTSSLSTSLTLTFSTIDPYKNIFYFVTDGKFTGVDIATGNIVSNPVLTNSNGAYFGQFLFDNGDNTIYGIVGKPSPSEIYLAKIDPVTGVVSNISPSSIASNVLVSTTVIDPFKELYYFITDGKFTAVNLTTGTIISNPTISNTNATYFEEYRYCGTCKMYTLRKAAAVDNSLRNSLQIYPNPATDKLYVDITESYNLKMQLYNTFGECILQKDLKTNSNEIDISTLAKGIYIVKCSDINGTMVKKLIKE